MPNSLRRWALPVAVLLAVPFALLGALALVLLRGFSNDIYFQIGLVTLIGLAAKNAILIVEIARQAEEQGADRQEAAVQAARTRLRPILMTSFAFILGVVPLLLATGAGAEMRQALGTAVFAGMLGVTFFGLFLTPVFFTTIRRLTGRDDLRSEAAFVADRRPEHVSPPSGDGNTPAASR